MFRCYKSYDLDPAYMQLIMKLHVLFYSNFAWRAFKLCCAIKGWTFIQILKLLLFFMTVHWWNCVIQINQFEKIWQSWIPSSRSYLNSSVILDKNGVSQLEREYQFFAQCLNFTCGRIVKTYCRETSAPFTLRSIWFRSWTPQLTGSRRGFSWKSTSIT